MNNMEGKFLPVGTVVMLKGGSKRLMITGFCVVAEQDKSKIYDYCGCLYPEGVVSTNQNAVFNHDQIQQVYHMGLKDEEEVEFKNSLNKLLNDKEILNVVSNNDQTNSNINNDNV